MVKIIELGDQIVRRGDETFFDPNNTVEFGAARMLVMDLDVAAKHLSEEFKASLSEIEWRALARARDKYGHHYEDIDRVVVWNLLKKRLPAMAETLR